MNKTIILGIIFLLAISFATARISIVKPIPIPPQPPIIIYHSSGSSGWVDSYIGYEHEFKEIKSNLWRFSQYSSRTAKDITGTNSYLYK